MTLLYDVAQRQHGVWSVDDARALGLTPSDVRREVATGLWRRAHRGVYVDALNAAGPLTVARAVTKAVSRSTASHTTAAAAHRLAVLRPGPPHATVPRQAPGCAQTGLVLTRRDLSSGMATSVRGIPVTSALQTVADVALGGDLAAGVVALDSALYQHLLRLDDLPHVAHAVRGRPGSAAAREALDLCRLGAESPLETLNRLALVRGGLPEPSLQHPVVSGAGGLVARLDMAYEQWLIGLECDGVAAHETVQALFRDRERQNALAALGWVLLRFTWADVTRTPERVVAVVRAAIARQQRQLAAS